MTSYEETESYKRILKLLWVQIRNLKLTCSSIGGDINLKLKGCERLRTIDTTINS